MFLNVIQSIHLWISKMKQYNSLGLYKRVNIAKKVLKLKYKIIGIGHNRIVYDLKNGNVLKVAISNLGLRNNSIESNIYTKCPSYLRKHLCPVKKNGHGWIVMRKMGTKVPINNRYDTQIDQLRQRFIEAGIKPEDMMNRANLALSKDRQIIVIDYGNFSMVGAINF